MNPETVPCLKQAISGHDSDRRYLESLIRTDGCHPNDSFEDLKRQAHFAKEDRGLLRDWLATAAHGESSSKIATRGKER
jgi:hypothetical protein